MVQDKNNIIALFLLFILIVFLSSPYVVKADASVNGFFPEDFVTKGYFSHEIENSFATRYNRNEPKTAEENQKIDNTNNCKQIIKTLRDSFAIPTELLSCARNIKPSN